MSRIGNRELTIPSGVNVNIENDTITVKGPKGELKLNKSHIIEVEEKDGKIITKRPNDAKTSKQLHGTTNALINNMIVGVTEGFQKNLETIGVGYKFQVQGSKLTISAGYSHPVVMPAPDGIKRINLKDFEEIALINKIYSTQHYPDLPEIFNYVYEFSDNIRFAICSSYGNIKICKFKIG